MKLFAHAREISIILLLSTLMACGGGNSNTTTTPPTVTTVSPKNGLTGVLNNSVLSITFSEDIDATTLTSTSFTLSGSSPVSGTIAYDASTRTASFTPDTPLSLNIEHIITLTTDVMDSAGNALTEVYTSRFTTEPFIRKVSENPSGVVGNDHSFTPSINADGRYVAFTSRATNLVNNDLNGTWDIFRHDIQTGVLTRVSVDSTGLEKSDGRSYFPTISGDGRYVVFNSSSSGLVSGDTNAALDIFRHDTQTGATIRVSVDSAGVEGNGISSGKTAAAISADGRYVVFESQATNLVSGDTNATSDIFRHDTQTGTTTRVNVDSTGTEANGTSIQPAISSDGRYVVFRSNASNLIGGDTNGTADIFRHDTKTGTTTRVNVDSTGTEANGTSQTPAISADGRYVVFKSSASNLVIGDTNGRIDIFRHDVQTGITIRVSVDSAGVEGNNSSTLPRISDNGRYVIFSSDATNLVSNDTNSAPDIFSYDTQTSTIIRVNVTSTNAEDNPSGKGDGNPAISGDGRYVVFDTDGTNLSPGGDGNGFDADVFRVLNTTP